MKWGTACFLLLLVGMAGAQVPDARPPDVSARWAEYYAAVYQVPVELVAAIIDEESGWNPYAVSNTRLVARLQTPVSSAVAAPVVAVVEYNYERNGQIVLAAGAKVLGRLTQVNPSGYVGIQFSRVEMPDGTTEKIDASAMSLNFGPLKGDVSGKKTGTKFLVRSLTGLGTIASYVVGPQGSASSGLISPNTLMRERLADNVATARTRRVKRPGVQSEPRGDPTGQHALLHRRPETIFGTWGYYVRDAKHRDQHRPGFTGGVPTLEELRQLMQLRSEINELYMPRH